MASPLVTQSGAASATSPVLSTGFSDYDLTAADPALFTRAADAGAQWVRLAADWIEIAPASRPPGFDASDPNSPGYDWTVLDQTLRLAAAKHLHVLLNIDGAPSWALGRAPANASNPGAWRPNAHDLGAFAHALAERYSGSYPDPLHIGAALPKVTDFQVWNEPNLSTYLEPQWTQAPNGRYVAASPGIYRSMLNDAYAGIKSVQPHSTVLAAGTAPYGDPPGGLRMKPVTFMEDLFCLSGPRLVAQKCPAVHLDGLDHHPYSTTPTEHAGVPGDVSIANMPELEHIAAVAERDHHILPAGPKPYWVTEISWGSIPPEKPYNAFPEPLNVQARYLSLAFYELWREGVSHVLWYLVQDNSAILGFDGSGVYFQSGVAKPSEAAFHFPFVALAAGHGAVRVWGRAPSSGRVLIQRKTASRWVTISSVTVSAGHVFQRILRLPTNITLRAADGTVISPSFSPRA